MPTIAPIAPSDLAGRDPNDVAWNITPGPMAVEGEAGGLLGRSLKKLLLRAAKDNPELADRLAPRLHEIEARLKSLSKDLDIGPDIRVSQPRVVGQYGSVGVIDYGRPSSGGSAPLGPQWSAFLRKQRDDLLTERAKLLKTLGVGSAAIATIIGGKDEAQAAGLKPATSSADNLDPILDRMKQRESSGNPNAKGKKGEIGLFQIQPGTAKQYGVDPQLLTNPVVNRYVAKRYLSDLVAEFKGNIPLAIAAYNAGPGRVRSGSIPDSTRSYVRDVLAGGTGLDAALTRPTAASSTTPSQGARPSIVTQTEMTPPAAPKASAPNTLTIPSVVGKFLGGGAAPAGAAETVPIPKGASIGAPVSAKTVPIPPDARFAMPSSITPPPAGPPSTEPLPVRAAGYLPAIGQFGGELGGVTAGAAIPGLGETGLPEAAFATAGGAGGAAIGAEGENAIRRQYGYPPVSVKGEAAIGGLTSFVPEVLPFVARARKAAALAKETGISFRAALDEVTQAGANLEGRLGMGPRKAQLLENAPATQVQKGYRAGKNLGLRELGQAYDSLLSKFYHRMTPNSVRTLFDNTVGRMLEISGKPLRRQIQEELDAQPMTVRRAQLIRSKLREIQRNLPAEMRGAKGSIQQLIDATTNDIKGVIGQANGQQLDAIDTYYSEQLKRFPEPKALQKVYSIPAAAEVILKTAKGDEARTVDMLREMRRAGQLDTLRNAVSTRIWQKAAQTATGGDTDAKFEALIKTVKGVDAGVFDELYGKGSRQEWIDTAAALRERTKDLLAHPNEAAAIKAEVTKYLGSPGMVENFARHLGGRAMFDIMIFGGGVYSGHLGFAVLGAGAIRMYEMAAHSNLAMKSLLKFATEKNPRLAARALLAFYNSVIVHGLAQYESAPTAPPAASPTPGGASATP